MLPSSPTRLVLQLQRNAKHIIRNASTRGGLHNITNPLQQKSLEAVATTTMPPSRASFPSVDANSLVQTDVTTMFNEIHEELREELKNMTELEGKKNL